MSTLPSLNITHVWSGSSTGCDTPYSTFFLEVEVPGVTSTATVTASVQGQNIPAQMGNTYSAGSYPLYFSAFPSLSNGTYTVTIRATAPGYSDTSTTTQVTYQC